MSLCGKESLPFWRIPLERQDRSLENTNRCKTKENLVSHSGHAAILQRENYGAMKMFSALEAINK